MSDGALLPLAYSILIFKAVNDSAQTNRTATSKRRSTCKRKVAAGYSHSADPPSAKRWPVVIAISAPALIKSEMLRESACKESVQSAVVLLLVSTMTGKSVCDELVLSRRKRTLEMSKWVYAVNQFLSHGKWTRKIIYRTAKKLNIHCTAPSAWLQVQK